MGGHPWLKLLIEIPHPEVRALASLEGLMVKKGLHNACT